MCNRVVRLEKPDGLSEARDFSHGFFTSLIPKAEEKELAIVSSYILKQIGDKKTSNRFAL